MLLSLFKCMVAVLIDRRCTFPGILSKFIRSMAMMVRDLVVNIIVNSGLILHVSCSYEVADSQPQNIALDFHD